MEKNKKNVEKGSICHDKRVAYRPFCGVSYFLVILYFLPVNQSLSHIIKFYGKGDYFPLISLERLGILLGFHLLLGSIHATVVAQLLK